MFWKIRSLVSCRYLVEEFLYKGKSVHICRALQNSIKKKKSKVVVKNQNLKKSILLLRESNDVIQTPFPAESSGTQFQVRFFSVAVVCLFFYF